MALALLLMRTRIRSETEQKDLRAIFRAVVGAMAMRTVSAIYRRAGPPRRSHCVIGGRPRRARKYPPDYARLSKPSCPSAEANRSTLRQADVTDSA
jgi:hypothetical protein